LEFHFWGIGNWEEINLFLYRLFFYFAQFFWLIQPLLTKINITVGWKKILSCDRMTG